MDFVVDFFCTSSEWAIRKGQYHNMLGEITSTKVVLRILWLTYNLCRLSIIHLPIEKPLSQHSSSNLKKV